MPNCPVCKEPLSPSLDRCPNCGQPLTGQAKASLEAEVEASRLRQPPGQVREFPVGLVVGAGALGLIALAFAAAGIWRMYNYDSSDRLVGGDAFNYIVLATRGVGLICAGVVAALFGCGVLLVGLLKSEYNAPASAPKAEGEPHPLTMRDL